MKAFFLCLAVFELEHQSSPAFGLELHGLSSWLASGRGLLSLHNGTSPFLTVSINEIATVTVFVSVWNHGYLLSSVDDNLLLS